MKTIKSVITLAFVLLLCLTAQAQWAGEDKEVLRDPDNLQTVSIGVHGSSDMCYEWEGPYIVSENRNQAVIVVNPQDAEQTYVCTRVSSCGVEQDLVKVKVIDTISIVSVTPTKCCYNEGDQILTSDFVILTYPPGYESLVQVSPNVASNSFELVGTGETQELTFSLTYNGYTSIKKRTVNVYNDALASSDAHSVNLMNFIHQLQSINNKVDKAKDVTKVINSLAEAGASPCSPNFNPSIEMPNTVVIHSCCNGGEVWGFIVNGNTYAVELSLSCDFPTAFSIPGIGGLYITVGGGVGASAGPLNFKYKGECSELSVPVRAYVWIEGGAKVKAGEVADASLTLVGKAQTTLNWVIGQSIQWQPLTVSVSVKGQVTFWNWYTTSVTYPLFSYQFFN